jgi:flagellar FliJ protein
MTAGLDTLRELSERQRDTARARLMQAEAQSNRAMAQLEQLRAYEADYRARTPGSAGAAAPIELLRCHQGFMGRLEQALVQQQEAVRRAEAELKLASVQKLLQRRQAEQGRAEARRDQRQADEAALQRHRRTTTGFGGLP